MQIVEPGRQQKGWAIETKCTGCGNGGGGCGALLRIEQGDLYRTSSAHYDGSDHYVTFTCGACGVESDLTWATVPSAVRETLPSKSAWLERRRQEVGDTTAAPTVSDFERGWRAAHRAALDMCTNIEPHAQGLAMRQAIQAAIAALRPNVGDAGVLHVDGGHDG